MAVEASHEDNVQNTIALDPVAEPEAEFKTVLYMRDGISLNGDRVRTYTSLNAVQADEAAGYVDAVVTSWARKAFNQRPAPKQIKVGKVDTVGLETYDDAYNLILAEDCEFWAVTVDTRTPATQVAFAAEIEADAGGTTPIRRFLILQSSDAAWKTPGLPAAYAAIDGYERTAVIYHDDDGEQIDGAWAVARAVFDPDVRSQPWDGRVRDVAKLTTSPTPAEQANLDDNFANHALKYGSAPTFVDGGWNINGRFIHEIMTADWFYQRMREDVIDLKLTYSDRGRKVPLDETGRTLIEGLIEGRLNTAVAADHFELGQTEATSEEISDTDKTLGRIRAGGAATFLQSGRLFEFNFAFGNNPINVTE